MKHRNRLLGLSHRLLLKEYRSALIAALLLWSAICLQAEKVALIQVNGAISPATAGYSSRGIDKAASENAQCLVLQFDTPGGLLDSTTDIVQSFYRSGVPVVVYVASGANATTAGCFITLASDAS